MAVAERDRRHFAVIAEAMAAEKAGQRAETLQTTAVERMRIGMLLGVELRDAVIEQALDERARAQIGLARRRPRPRS
jgi:hypothetical protein